MELYEVKIFRWKGRDLQDPYMIPELINKATLDNLKALGQDHRIRARKILSVDLQDQAQALLDLGLMGIRGA